MLSASRLCPSTPLGPLAPDPRYWVALSRSACAPQVDFAPISFSLAPALVYIAVGSDPLTFWATVCKTVRPMLSARCLSVCPVCNVGVLWPNGWMDQDKTWHGSRPRPRPHCVRWGHSSRQRGTASPIFGPYLLWPNGWMHQDTTWYTEVGLGPGDIMLDGDPAPTH